MDQSQIIRLLVSYSVLMTAVGLLCHWLARSVFHGSSDADQDFERF